MPDLLDGRDVHRRREGVVGGLALVDVVVGVDGLLRAHLAAEDLDRAVRDDLVGVHVGLRPAPGLPDDQREVFVELALDDFVGRLDDGLRLLGGQRAPVTVHDRRGLLEDPERADQLPRETLPLAADREVVERALGLGSPVPVRRDFDLPHRVGLGSGLFRLRHGS